MHTPEEVQRRIESNRRQMMFGHLGAMSTDKAIMGMSEPMLKQALEQQKAKTTDHGEFDSLTGSFKYFPQVRKQLDVERAEKQLEAGRTKQSQAQTAWDAARQRADEMQILRQMAIDARMSRGGGNDDKGSVTVAGSHPQTGEPVYNHSKRGLMMRDAQGNWIPYNLPVAPKPTNVTAGETTKLADAEASIKGIEAGHTLAKGVLDQKGISGTASRATMGIIPGMVSSAHPLGEAVMARVQPQEVRNLREQVSNTVSLIRAGRYGLTLTAKELADAVQYNVTPYDSAEQVVSKAANMAKVLRDAYDARTGGIDRRRPGMPTTRSPEMGGPGTNPNVPVPTQGPSTTNSGGVSPIPNAAPAPVKPLTQEEALELEQRRARARGGQPQ
jgi:hypothetical protein